MRTKDDELKRHMASLKSLYPEVEQHVWGEVAWRMESMWTDGQFQGIGQMASNYAKARQAEQVEQRYLDRAGER